jgi:hypothetical protein
MTTLAAAVPGEYRSQVNMQLLHLPFPVALSHCENSPFSFKLLSQLWPGNEQQTINQIQRTWFN